MEGLEAKVQFKLQGEWIRVSFDNSLPIPVTNRALCEWRYRRKLWAQGAGHQMARVWLRLAAMPNRASARYPVKPAATLGADHVNVSLLFQTTLTGEYTSDYLSMYVCIYPSYNVLDKAKDHQLHREGLYNSEIRTKTRHFRQLIADIREKVRTRQNLFKRRFPIGRHPKDSGVVTQGLCERSRENPRKWNQFLAGVVSDETESDSHEWSRRQRRFFRV
jgi:hypothetical protein